jgi:16S rRNA (guanine527-N7)-methyltransferase
MGRDLAKYEVAVKKDYQQKELERLGLTPEDDQHLQTIGFLCYIYDENTKSSVVPAGDKDGNYFIRHFMDSIQPLLLFGFERGATVLDINSGIGFPAIPTAIFRPDLDVTVVETNVEQYEFMKELVEVVGISNVTVVNSLDDIAAKKFDNVMERGAATLWDFTRVAKKYTASNGRMYTYRTENFEEELSEITVNKEKEGVCVNEIAEYDLANKIYGLNLVAFELF